MIFDVFSSKSLPCKTVLPCIEIFILLSFLLPFSCLFGQEGKVLTLEVFVCNSTARPIKDVAIYDTENRLRSVTNREGMARVAT